MERAEALENSKREYIDSIRRPLENLKCKTPEDQDVFLLRDETRRLATITFKSGAKNALSGKMISKFTQVLDELEGWTEARGVMIRGHGGTFCSGSDLVTVRETASNTAGLHLAQIMQYNLMRLQRLPVVSVAFVEGFALGGGAELATGADLRVMSERAKIGFVHAKVGVCCGWGGGARLVQLVGPSRAMDLLASGRTVAAAEAVQMGLANQVVASETEAMDYLAARSIGPRRTMRALKLMVNSARMLPFEQALEVEGQLFASTWGREEHLHALDQNIKHKQ